MGHVIAKGRRAEEWEKPEDRYSMGSLLETLPDELFPIHYPARHHSCMDEVKRCGPCPVFLNVVYIECAIWWNTTMRYISHKTIQHIAIVIDA